MRAGFAKAKADGPAAAGADVASHPGFRNHWRRGRAGRYFGPSSEGTPIPIPASAFDDYVATLTENSKATQAVRYLHGDTHLLRMDKPLLQQETKRLFENSLEWRRSAGLTRIGFRITSIRAIQPCSL